MIIRKHCKETIHAIHAITKMEKSTNSARNIVPKVVSYRFSSDLSVLKDWLYNFSEAIDNRPRAIQRVKALSSRGKLPHAVESTALLTSILLSDPSTHSNHPKEDDSNILQLSYSMGIIRFVNGLLDPFQQGTFAISLHHLARNLNLPSFFVELRHMGTHEQLPNINILRIGCNKALNWLFDNYWCDVEDIALSHTSNEPSMLANREHFVIGGKKCNAHADASQIMSYLRTYKRIRKQDLDTIYEEEDMSEGSTKYWKTISSLKNFLIDDTSRQIVLDCLIFKNFLLYNHDKLIQQKSDRKFKFNSLIVKLYKPLLDAFGIQFKYQLLQNLLDHSHHYKATQSHEDDYTFHHDDEILQAQEWIKTLLVYISSYESPAIIIGGQYVNSKSDLYLSLITIISKYSDNQQLKAFGILENELKKDSGYGELRSEVTKLRKQAKIKSFLPTPSLDDILNTKSSSINDKRSNEDNETIAKIPKRPKIQAKNNEKTMYLLEEHKFWNPLPFGISN